MKLPPILSGHENNLKELGQRILLKMKEQEAGTAAQ